MKVTAIYGINLNTERCTFVKHKNPHYASLGVYEEPACEIDIEGDVHGLKVVKGVGYETEDLEQLLPYKGNDSSREGVFARRSGDKTVNYQSLRWPATWEETCEVDLNPNPNINPNPLTP